MQGHGRAVLGGAGPVDGGKGTSVSRRCLSPNATATAGRLVGHFYKTPTIQASSASAPDFFNSLLGVPPVQRPMF